MSEEWRPIVGWESFYAVSDQGRVKSLPDPFLEVHRGRPAALRDAGRHEKHLIHRLTTTRRERRTAQAGHPYDETNTYFLPRGGRSCRECKRISRKAAA